MSEEEGPILRLRVNKDLQNGIFNVAKFTKASWTELVRQWIREKVEHYEAKREYRDFIKKEGLPGG